MHPSQGLDALGVSLCTQNAALSASSITSWSKSGRSLRFSWPIAKYSFTAFSVMAPAAWAFANCRVTVLRFFPMALAIS